MRFCMLSTFYPPWSFGGDAVQVKRLSEALVRRGHEVTVVHSREAFAALTHELPEAPAESNGVRVIGIDAGRGLASPLATYLTGRPLLARRQLEEALAEEFDVLHFHNPSLLGGPGVLGMGRCSVRTYTLHEQWLVCPTHVLWKYEREVCTKPDCVRCTIAHRRPPQPWRATRLLERSLRHLDVVIAPSDSTARLHASLASLVRIERLDHFVPDPPDVPAPPPAERPYVLFAGRLEPIKCIPDLIDAVAGLPDVDLVIAGAGGEDQDLRRRAEGLTNVRMLGWVPPADLEALYRGAHAVALPTRGYESCPLVLLEAFSRGVPVIARSFGGQGELLEVSGGGLGYRTPEELRHAIARIVREPGLRESLGRRGREAFLERWTEEAHVERYEALLADAAARREHVTA